MASETEVIEKASKFYRDTKSTNLSDLESHSVDLKPWEIYETDLSWSEVLNKVGVHWSEKNEYTEEDIYKSVQEFVEENHVSSDAYAKNNNYPTLYPLRNMGKSFNEIVGEIFDVSELEGGVARCQDCGGIYKSLGHHWKVSDCSYLEISDRNKEMMKGILMGDGTVSQGDGGSCVLSVVNTRPLFLSWLYNEMPVIFNEPRLDISSEERVEKERNLDSPLFDFDEDREFKDMYVISTRTHPYFPKLRQKWYSDEGKVFPDDLELTPPLLKMWYVTDGGLSFKNGKDEADCVRIYTKNENHRLEYLSSLFDEVGLRNYETEYAINIPAVDDFFEFIGREHVPGFEYKWCTDDYEAYKRNKETYGSLSG